LKDRYKGENLGYYIDELPDDISKNSPHRIEGGVILTKIPYTQEYKPHATSIASHVIRNLENEILDEAGLSESLWKPSADWLLDNMDKNGRIWHDFKLPFYDFTSPWVGGLAQGLTISALVRAYDVGGDYGKKEYLEGAKKAFNGLKYCLKDGWVEEYPGVPTILNGNIYALFGLYDLRSHFSAVEPVIETSLKTLISNIQKFDIGYWSSYDLKTPATKFYHKIHIKQLNALSDLSKYHEFSIVADTFRDYMKSYKNYNKSLAVRSYLSYRKHGLLGLYKVYRKRKDWEDE
jgi:hypothetical protein